MGSRKLVVSIEHRFFEREGQPYTRLSFSYEYWRRFLVSFDEVVVVARLQKGNELSETEEANVVGPGVTFFPMPYYVGPREFIKVLPRIIASSWRISGREEKFLLRSGNISNIMWLCLSLRGKPYLREFPGSLKEGILGFTGDRSLVMRAVAEVSDWVARWQARRARACSYVSDALRRAYPAKNSEKEFVFSSVQLVSAVSAREHQELDNPVKIGTVGRLELEKGHRYLIEAINIAKRNSDITFILHIIGDGSQMRELRRLSAELEVNGVFHGAIVDKERMFRIVREWNLFVLPSETEGMPRALIEAMSLKVPCVASQVGGVPEVMDPRFMVPAGDALSISHRIVQLCESRKLREENAENHYDLVHARFSESRSETTMREFWSQLA